MRTRIPCQIEFHCHGHPDYPSGLVHEDADIAHAWFINARTLHPVWVDRVDPRTGHRVRVHTSDLRYDVERGVTR
ncbi:hypothetical protein ACWEQ4_01015 [Rhodococcus sp. NPDC003994]